MGAASLESLTNELFEQVVQHLNLNDIRNLRLGSRSTAFKAAQDTYRAFFRKKHVDLRRETLDSFVKVTSQSGVGCLVEDLSLVGIVYNPKDLQDFIESGGRKPQRKGGSSRKVKETYSTAEELEAAKKDLATLLQRRKEDEALRADGNDVVMLSKAFSNIVSSKRSTLKRLYLRIKTHRGDTVPKPRPSLLRSSSPIFQAATSTFWLAMESLRNSQLKLQALDIFFAWHEQLECSLPCDNLGNLGLAPDRIGACLSTIKVLSVSITDPIVEETKYDIENFGEEEESVVQRQQRAPGAGLSRDKIGNEKNYSALSQMLELCPSLEELNIVGYQLGCSDEELQELQKAMRRQHLHYLANATPLSRLHKLNLASMEVQDNDLLTFLGNHSSSLRELELTNIALPERSFSSIVSYITGEDMGLEAIRLENMSEPHALIHFRCDWEREGVDLFDRDVVRRWGPERKTDISYFGRELGQIGSPLVWHWTLEQPTDDEEGDDDIV